MPVDRETGKRRGFAFVEFSDPAHAEEASRRLNNQPFKGRNITINEARARENRPDFRPAPRSGISMRPAGIIGVPRPSFISRPNPQDFGPNPMENGRADRRSRSFGPDAKPARKRKSYGQKTEMGYKRGPIRERIGGQFFGYEDDDVKETDCLSPWRDSEEEDAV
jgi:RNA recognition motif-containing protein